MKNKMWFICSLVLSFMCFNLNVFAEAGSGDEYEDDFNKGAVKISVNSSQMVTLYGKSVCNGSTCTVEYAGQYSKFEDVLKNNVVCTNGEKNINYQVGSSGKTGLYDASNSQENFSGTMYWAEEYLVTCTTNSGMALENAGQSNNGGTSNGTNNGNTTGGSTNTGASNNGNSSGDSTNTGTSDDEYSSAGTVENPEQGVNTYFLVLGLIALISYLIMVSVKKFNLFKNV